MSFSAPQKLLLKQALIVDDAIRLTTVELRLHLHHPPHQFNLNLVEDLCLWMARECEMWLELCRSCRRENWYNSPLVQSYFSRPFHLLRHEALSLPPQLHLRMASGLPVHTTLLLRPQLLAEGEPHRKELGSLLERPVA